MNHSTLNRNEQGKTGTENSSKAHEQKSIANQIHKTQSVYMRNQEKTHNKILDKGSNQPLEAVRDCDTKELHTVPNKVTETVSSINALLTQPHQQARQGSCCPTKHRDNTHENIHQ